MERKTKSIIRRKKHLNVLRALLIILVAALLAFYGHLFFSAALIVVYYLVREAYLSDHIFYSVKDDYIYGLSPDWKLAISNATIIDSTTIPVTIDTLLLAVKINCRPSGYFFDPYVQIEGDGFSYRQYFERGIGGLRYINLTQLARVSNKSAALTLSFQHCCAESHGELLGFESPLTAQKRIMVIAPHADDAELAAFGVYSQHDTMIVTVTAGEIEADAFQRVESDPVKASQLKGQLRSHDSLAAGLWAGLAAKKVVSLGYFCKQLSRMYDHPSDTVVSLTAGTNDPRMFRRFNSIRLKSDANANASWVALIGDLKELLDQHRPDIIITPHPRLDPHPDHIFATRALAEALQDSRNSANTFLLYANHYHNTQMAPFGPAHSAVGLAPQHAAMSPELGVYSHVLDQATRTQKAMALQLMHDLQKSPSGIKRLRPTLQKWLAGRPETIYGHDDFFRKAVRCHEVFFVADYAKLRELLSEK